ncbi:MAG: galactose oxidase [Hymenobacter sp.]|nr:MAG: galactose oxidase [Hymenobacter sp.]
MKNFSLRAGRFLTLALLLIGLGLSSCKKDSTSTTVTGNWTAGNSFPGVTRSGAVTFVINGIAYVGTGNDVSSTRLRDFYAFDPSKGSWTQMTPLPSSAPARYLAAAFSANNKGYVGTGYAQDGTYLSDFWQFDPATPTVTTTTSTTGTTTTTTTLGTWTRIQDFPLTTTGTGRRGAVAGSVNNVGYVGCGFGGNYEKDMYRYNASSNSWTDIGFPGNKRVNAAAFTLNNVLYMGFGTNNAVTDTQFWAYDPSANTWTQKRNLANVSNSTESYDYSGVARTQTAAFAVNSLGYVAVGNNGSNLLTCYEYDPTADSWTLKNPFTGSARSLPVAFGIGNLGYVGLGSTGSTPFDDFWKFDPNAAQQ